MKKALFLDRDGIICRTVKYEYGWDSAQRPEDVTLVKGIEKVIGWANKNGIPVIEISNQPGVAKGKMNQKTSDEIEARVHELLKEKNIAVDEVYVCQHHPDGVVVELTSSCGCRKPKPGLLLQAAKDLNIDLKKSGFLGDKASDVVAGKAVGCKTIIFLHNDDLPEKIKIANTIKADYKTESMEEILAILENLFK